MRRALPLLGTLAMLTLLAAGCGATPQPVAQKLPPKPASSPKPETVPKEVPATLKFTGTTLDGQPFDAATLAGTPVILWFWAPWCATCMGQAAGVTEMASQYAGRVTVLGIAGLDQSVPAMKQFVAEGEVGNIQHLNDRDGGLWKRFGITEQSTFVLINRSGKVMATSYLDVVTLEDWAAYLDRH